MEAALISRRKYLSTTFRPDREYIDGRLLERNVAERDHGVVHTRLADCLRSLGGSFGGEVAEDQRLQVSDSRYRVPDVCVVAGKLPDDQVLTNPPMICAEVLSKDDRMTDMQERIDDYLEFGVQSVWLVDPRRRAVSVYTKEGSRASRSGCVPAGTPNVQVPLSEIFGAL